MSRRWLLDTLERALSTAAQALLAMLPLSYVPGVVLDLRAALLAALFAGVACVLKCVAALRVGASDSASLLPADVDPPQPPYDGNPDRL